MADAQQSKSLTTGKDVPAKRNLATTAAQPNRRREGGHLFANIFVLAFCIAGINLAVKHQVRGNEYWFIVAFAVAIGVTGLEILLNILLMVFSSKMFGKPVEDEEQCQCCKHCGIPCVSAMVSSFYICNGCAAFALLVYALSTSTGVEATEACGCANNYGCANIMAIIASICYGARVLSVVICLPCLLCVGCCATLCACSACCFASAAARNQDVELAETGQAKSSK